MNRRFVSTLTPEEKEIRSLAACPPEMIASDPNMVGKVMAALCVALGDVSRLRREADDREETIEMLQACLADARANAASGDYAKKRLEAETQRRRNAKATVSTLSRRLSQPAALGEVPDVVAGVKGLCLFASQLTSPPCVYFLIERGEVVYVGQTICLLNRIAEHYDKGEGKTFDSVYFLPVPANLLSEVERVMIARFAPRLNVSRPQCLEGDMVRVCRRFGLEVA